jgi:hypothetical protein
MNEFSQSILLLSVYFAQLPTARLAMDELIHQPKRLTQFSAGSAPGFSQGSLSAERAGVVED